jgi:hypothetical protein
MRRLAGTALAFAVLVPASAGAGTAAPPLAISATPARVTLAGSGEATVRVTNPGQSPLVVDVSRATFALDLRGRPTIAMGTGRRIATWLAVHPARLVVPVGATRPLTVTARLPRLIEPGDHDALVLLTTSPRRGASVAVRMRLGIVVVVRAPGRVVRRLAVAGLRVRRGAGGRILEAVIVNRGNVTETLARGQVRVVLRRGGAQVRLRAGDRDLRPRTRGVVRLRYAGRLAGWVTATVEISARGVPAARRTFRIKL